MLHQRGSAISTEEGRNRAAGNVTPAVLASAPPVALCPAMDWQPIKTAPPRTRVLICDDARRVQIGRAGGLRWYDDAGHPLSVCPKDRRNAR